MDGSNAVVYRTGMLGPITADCLNAIEGIRHGFFTRAGGVSEGVYASLNCGYGSRDNQNAVAENRARVARHLGAASPQIAGVYQVHGAVAIAVTAMTERGSLPQADAIVTATPGLAVGVLTADCAPILLADPDANVVAAAHAGWRGAVAGIIEATLNEMEALGASRNSIRAAVGPCISQTAYEVGPEFEADVLAHSSDSARFFMRIAAADRARFDLPAYVIARLQDAGVGIIENRAACTYADESKFFSFRRTTHRSEPDYGRQIAAIVVA